MRPDQFRGLIGHGHPFPPQCFGEELFREVLVHALRVPRSSPAARADFGSGGCCVSSGIGMLRPESGCGTENVTGDINLLLENILRIYSLVAPCYSLTYELALVSSCSPV